MRPCRIKVRAYECDSYAHVNNAVYLNYLEYAREELLEEAGIPFTALLNQGLLLVISEINIQYKSSALAGEELTVVSSPLKSGATFGILEQTIFRPDGLEAIKAQVKFVCTDKSGRPQRLPGPLGALFTPA